MEIFDPSKSPAARKAGQGEPTFVKGAVLEARVLESPAPGRVHLKVGSRLIKAIISQAIEPGRSVNLVVAETSPRLVLRLITHGPSESRPQTDQTTIPRSGPGPQALDGPTLLARIVDRPAVDQIRLHILSSPSSPSSFPGGGRGETGLNMRPGREVSARLAQTSSDLNLRPGQEVKFQVTETSPRLVLRVTDQTTPQRPPLVQALADFLGDPAQLSKSAALLMSGRPLGQNYPPQVQDRTALFMNLLANLSPEAGAPDNQFLVRLTNLLGLAGERSQIQEQTARLLAEIIRSPAMERLKDTPQLRSLLEGAARLYEAADKIQTLNQQTMPREQTLLLPFPIIWPGEKGWGEVTLKWPPPEEHDRQDRPFQVGFILNLTKLGRVKIELQMRDKTIRGVIWTKDGNARSAVEHGLGGLIQAMELRGFKVADLTARIFPQEAPESLAADMLAEHKGLIDIKV